MDRAKTISFVFHYSFNLKVVVTVVLLTNFTIVPHVQETCQMKQLSTLFFDTAMIWRVFSNRMWMSNNSKIRQKYHCPLVTSTIVCDSAAFWSRDSNRRKWTCRKSLCGKKTISYLFFLNYSAHIIPNFYDYSLLWSDRQKGHPCEK